MKNPQEHFQDYMQLVFDQAGNPQDHPDWPIEVQCLVDIGVSAGFAYLNHQMKQEVEGEQKAPLGPNAFVPNGNQQDD